MPPLGVSDPTPLYRVRDGVYAPDLLIAAVAEFDLFSWIAGHGPLRAPELRAELGLTERPTDVLLTYCAALGLVDRDVADGDRIALTDLARHHLVDGSAFDLRAYYASLRNGRRSRSSPAFCGRTSRRRGRAVAPPTGRVG